LVIPSAKILVAMSPPDPAGKGYIIRIGLSGYSPAMVSGGGPEIRNAAITRLVIQKKFIIALLLILSPFL
jgi:hypothetical protein